MMCRGIKSAFRRITHQRLAVVVAVVFTLYHFVTTQRTMGWTKSLLGQYTQPYTHHVNPVRRQQQYRTSRHAAKTDIIKPVVLEVVASLNVANLATL